MLLLRKILFYVFALIYIILCPLMILYALGINIHPGSSKTIEETGLIYLSTYPAGASIEINNKHISQVTPTTIDNLKPGEYVLTLSLKNYRSWSNTVSVEKTKATTINHLLLIPENWSIEPLSNSLFENFVSSPLPPYLVTKSGQRLKDLSFLNLPSRLSQDFMSEHKFSEATTILPVFPSTFMQDDIFIDKIFSVPGSVNFLIKTSFKDEIRYFWLTCTGKTPAVKDITALLPAQFDDITWDATTHHELYLFHDGSLDLLDLMNENYSANIITGVKSFSIRDNDIYALMKDNNCHRFDRKGTLIKSYFSPQLVDSNTIFKNDTWKIDVLSTDLVAFMNQKGTVIINESPFVLLENGARGIKYERSTHELLIWKKDALGYVELKNKNPDNSGIVNAQIVWINLTFKEIEQALWINNGAQIIYVDDGHIYLTDRESFGKSRSESIADIKSGSEIKYDESQGRIFFIGTDNLLKTTVIIPQEIILPLQATNNQ